MAPDHLASDLWLEQGRGRGGQEGFPQATNQLRINSARALVPPLPCSFCSAWAPFFVLHLPLSPAPRSGAGAARVRPGADVHTALRRFFRDELVAGVECGRCSLAATLAAALPDGGGNGGSTGGGCSRATVGSEDQTGAAAQRQQGLGDREQAAGRRELVGHQQQPPPPPPPPPEQQQQQASPPPSWGIPQLLGLAAAQGPLPPVDLSEAAAAAGLAWAPVRCRVAKRSLLARVPAALALHLQRTVCGPAGAALKLMGHVAFPVAFEAAELKQFAGVGGATDAPGGGGSGGGGSGLGGGGGGDGGGGGAYHLVAVVQHLGASSSSGHYVVYRRLTRAPSPESPGPPSDVAAFDRGMERVAVPLVPAGAGPVPASLPLQALQLGPSGANWGPALGPVAARQQLGPGRAPATAPAAAASDGGSGGGAWVRISDASVERVHVREVLGCDATLLLYERRRG
jgi:hypothetical protein